MSHLKRLSQISWPLTSPVGLLYPVINDALQYQEKPVHFRTGPCIRLRSLEDAFDAFSISDGQTLSFHHHYRDGDRLVNEVLSIARRRRIRGLTIAASSLFMVHAPLAELIEDGTVANIVADYILGPAADAISMGKLDGVALLQSHGGRARAIAAGQLKIDVAFVGASIANIAGDATGRIGSLACGPLGYPAVDAAYARVTVVAAHQLSDQDLPVIDIPRSFVDAVVQFDRPGHVSGISSGSTIPSVSSTAKKIGALVADLIEAAGLMRDGISLQSGAGGYSLGAVPIIGERMARNSVRGSFISGGITGAHVAMLEAGYFNEIRDVQCFDGAAVQSSATNPKHRMMTAAEYASPINPTAVVDDLTLMLLGAAEVDCDFNVNVMTGANGRVLGGPGGHPDTAQGAQLSIVTTELTGGGFAKIVRSVRTVCTEGRHVDAVVTDAGIAVNPLRADLVENLRTSGLPLLDIEELRRMADDRAVSPPKPRPEEPTFYVEHRNGRLIDWA